MKNHTEIIAKYINDELSATEKLAFEKELANNTELKKEYDLQLQIIKGTKRLGVQKQVSTSFKNVKTKKLITKAVVGIAITIAVIGAVILINKTINKPTNQVLYELNEQGTTNWSEADKQLEAQIFKINPLRDTIIETRNGIVFSVPANVFISKTGQALAEYIDLEIKEALTPLEIMKAGLSTTSNGKLLETGGMFYINARIGNENLSIDKNNPINASVPVNNNKKDMLLFKGERMADGSINWVDPKPLKKKLSTVDITKLNFYPEHFLDTLKSMGFDIKNKKLTDSIYYSFSVYKNPDVLEADFEVANDTIGVVSTTTSIVSQLVTSRSISNIFIPSKIDSVKRPTHTSNLESTFKNPEINPSRIKAIWDKKFNGTILATKEFEERLKVIFTTCDASLINLYINNLNKNLYEIDSLAFTLLSGDAKQKFIEFYERRDGGIAISDYKEQKLQTYFEEKRNIYNNAITNTLKNMYEAEKVKTKEANTKINKQTFESMVRNSITFNEELELNLDEAYKQLGYKRVKVKSTTNNITSNVYSGAYYSAPILQTGWCNIDRYTLESTINRTTLNFTDSWTDKKAIIKYEPITIAVNDYKNYDRVVCYMIPNKLSSFQLMKNAPNGFKETLNELMNYSIITIGFKGNDTYYNEISSANAQAYTIDLKKIKTSELDKKLSVSFQLNQQADILRDIDYQLFDINETKRQAKINKREEIRSRLYPVVFPCSSLPIVPTKPVIKK